MNVILGTELLRDPAGKRYVTIDRWISEEACESFRTARADQYAAIDAQCESLTERERCFHPDAVTGPHREARRAAEAPDGMAVPPSPSARHR